MRRTVRVAVSVALSATVVAVALLVAPSQSPLLATDRGPAGGVTPTGGVAFCQLQFAASDGLFSVNDTVVVPLEEIFFTTSGWLPDNRLDYVLRNVTTGAENSGFILTDSAGNESQVFSVPEGLDGEWIQTVTEPDTGCEAQGGFLVLPLTDILHSKFLHHIKWLFVQGITTGCSATAYCPDGRVTRGQMATFLVRALKLPPTSTDYFTDDEGSIHENNINRLRAAGITAGCGGSRFCPNGVVTRAQMATFLVRAYGLPPTSTDYFTDDEGSIHESNINRLRASGVTAGCTATTYCPSGAVTRGQMAAFLKRAAL